MLGACPFCKFVPSADVSPLSAEYHRQHKAVHMAANPNDPHGTEAELDDVIARFERMEASRAARAS